MGDAVLILADTQAVVWYDAGDPQLGPEAREAFEDALGEDALFVSAVSFCEVAWLARNGRIALPGAATAWRRSLFQRGVKEIALDGEMAVLAAELAEFHKDPADRLIVATALQESLRLLTSDRRILAWSGPLDRLDARR